MKSFVKPAVEGTLNVLNACLKAPSVRRVIVTSSTAAIVCNKTTPHTEADWNTVSTLDTTPYAVSKTLAEQAAWKFMDTNHPHFTLTAINPCLIFGPVLSDDSSIVNTSTMSLLNYATGNLSEIKFSCVFFLYSSFRPLLTAHSFLLQELDYCTCRRS